MGGAHEPQYDTPLPGSCFSHNCSHATPVTFAALAHARHPALLARGSACQAPAGGPHAHLEAPIFQLLGHGAQAQRMAHGCIHLERLQRRDLLLVARLPRTAQGAARAARRAFSSCHARWARRPSRHGSRPCRTGPQATGSELQPARHEAQAFPGPAAAHTCTAGPAAQQPPPPWPARRRRRGTARAARCRGGGTGRASKQSALRSQRRWRCWATAGRMLGCPT